MYIDSHPEVDGILGCIRIRVGFFQRSYSIYSRMAAYTFVYADVCLHAYTHTCLCACWLAHVRVQVCQYFNLSVRTHVEVR